MPNRRECLVPRREPTRRCCPSAVLQSARVMSQLEHPDHYHYEWISGPILATDCPRPRTDGRPPRSTTGRRSGTFCRRWTQRFATSNRKYSSDPGRVSRSVRSAGEGPSRQVANSVCDPDHLADTTSRLRRRIESALPGTGKFGGGCATRVGGQRLPACSGSHPPVGADLATGLSSVCAQQARIRGPAVDREPEHAAP